MTKKIGVLVGSLRKDSNSELVAKSAIDLLPEGYEGEILEIGHLPFYNQDHDKDSPQEFVEFRDKVKGVDAILFVTPEYNRSVPAVLKNAIDLGSRPWGESVWGGKPAAVFSSSTGAIGGFGATHHLRQSLAFLDMPLMGQPEVYLGNFMDSLDESGKLDERTTEFLKDAVDAFVAHIEKHLN